MYESIFDRIRVAGRRRKLSPRTIKTYLTCIKEFLNFTQRPTNNIRKSDIKKYLEHIAKKNYTGKTIHYCATKFLMEEVLQKRRIWLPLKFSKEQKRYPDALSKNEVQRLINTIENPQHRLMIQLMYGAGLRVSELINLKPEDIHEDYGWVRKGKGAKDRIFIVPKSIHINVTSKPYLFMSNRNKKYSPRTISAIVDKAAKHAKIKHVHPHMLRHSFATHSLGDGYDLLTVQVLLGHASPETSMVYVHMTKPKLLLVKSPLD